MTKQLKLIKGVENTQLKLLNEGEALKNPDKYVFQGVFTQCSTPEHKVVNRNGRIYMATEMLRHLGYLRDMIKENNGRLPGELDHPEGRFDVQLKEASHVITDLWYDESTQCVMGRLEVLDTPNGKTLKALIDAGFPLYVSSRAAGDVNERTKEVEIAQIFTYDVVCTPGFKEAKLERVNESLGLPEKALKYINEAVSNATLVEKKDIEVPAEVINESALAEYNDVTVADVCKPLLEDEDKKEEEPLNDVQNFLPIQNTSGKKAEKVEEGEDEAEEKSDDEEKKSDAAEGDEEKSEDKEGEESSDEAPEEGDAEGEESSDEAEGDELTDDEKEENRKLILDVVGLDADGEPVGDSEEDKEDSESEDKKDDILDIEGAEGDEDSEGEEEKSDDAEGEESSEEETSESEEAEDECKGHCEKKEKIKKDTDADIAELESILDSVQKAESVKESIIRRYPFAISLSEKNFARFANLRPNLKKRCAEFIEENEIFDIRAINELWDVALREDKKAQQNWLKLASQEDIDLYVAAPVEVQNAIEESAKYVILNTAEDVDLFWQRTGLRQAAAQKMMNEKFVQDYNNQITEQSHNELGYSDEIIKLTEQYFNLYE